MEKMSFEKAFAVDCSKQIDKKKAGKGKELSYLSWAWAWAKFKVIYPDAEYEIVKFDGLPYVADMTMGIIVYTRVRVCPEDNWLEMWLPVMDPSNKAMKLEPYSYKSYDWDQKQNVDKYVAAADMFDINKTLMRCLTKNLAMFGLGLSIYAGEDIPQPLSEEEEGAIKAEFEARKGKTGKPSTPGVKEAPALQEVPKKPTLTMAMYENGKLQKAFDWLLDRFDPNTAKVQPGAVDRMRASYDWADGVLEQIVKDVEKFGFKNDINK